MRLARLLIVGPFVLLYGCPEAPECVDFEGDGEYTLDCSAGKVPACGDDPDLLYDVRNGALLPTPEARDRDGDGDFDLQDASCVGINDPGQPARCRPRPTCARLNDAYEPADVDPRPVCPDRLAPRCVLGVTSEIPVTTSPQPDSGTDPQDAGPADGGATDDAGTDDAGTDDAGTDDAAADDAGTG